MSPALVDSVNRTSTPQMQTQHSFMQNPNPKGQVPSPFLFDFSGFPSEQLGRPSQTDSETMNSFNVGLGAYSNQNPNVSNFQSGSALPSNSRLGSEKPSFGHTSGLSKPRLLKVRKHLGSQPVRPSPTSGTRVDPGFNPFRQASANVERAEDKSRVQELHNQWCGWKPFSSELGHDGRDSSSSGASTSSDCRFGKSGYANFVFSANKSGSSLESEMIGSRGNVEKSHPENMGKSKFGSEMEFQDAKGAAFGFDASGKGVLNSCEGIDKGAFVFGVSSKKNSKFDGSNISGLPDEMRKLNIFASENGEAVEKTSSCGNVWKSHPEDMGNSKFGSETEFQDAKGAAFGFDASGKGVLNSGEGIDKGAFVFGVSSKKNSKFDGSNVSGLPDEMRKLNIVASEHGEAVEKTKDTYLSTKNSDKNTFFFGINSNVACDCVGSGNGVIVEEAKDTSLRSKASNENILFSRSINNAAGSCSSSGNDNGVENSKDTGDCLKSNNKNNFECGRNVASGFGGSRNIDNVEKTKNPNIISNASDKNNFVFYNNNDVVRDPIGSVNVDNFEKTKDSNLGSKTTYTINFAFGSSKNIATAFGSSESGDDAGNTKNSNLSSVDSDRKNPVIGSNSNLASGFHGSENEDGVEKSEGVNLSSNASNKSNMASDFVGTDSGVWKTKDADLSPKANDKNIFIFGGLNHAGCASATAVSELPHEMKKLNIEDSRKADGAEKQESYTNDKIPFVCSGKKATDFFARCSATTIHDRMKKLNISGSGSGDRIRRGRRPTFKTSDQKFFVFGSSNTTASSSVGTAEDDLRNEIRKFNIGSQMRDSTGQGDISHPPSGIFVFGSSNTAANYSVGTAEDNLPDEIRKLNIGIKTGNSTGQADMGLPTPGISVKEKQPENLGAEPFHDPEVSNSAPKSFAFKTGFHGKGSDEIPPVQPSDGTNPSGDAATSFSFALNDVPFQPFVNVFEVTSMDRAEKKDGFSFPSTQHGSGKPQTDLRMADEDVLFSSTGFVGLNQKLQFSAKRGAAKGSRLKKRRGKLRQPMASQQLDGKDFVSKESNSQEILESPGCYSPMDFSPYQETLVTDQCSRETSMTSNDSFHLDNSYVSSNVHPAVSTDARDEDLVAAAQRLDIDDGNQECRESKFSFSFKESVSDECPTDEFVSGTEKERSKSTTEQVNVSAFVTSAEPESGFSSKTVRQESDFKQFSFTSSLEHVGETDFTFAASSSDQGHSTVPKHHHRKKNRMKIGHNSYSSSSNTKFQAPSSTVQFSTPLDTPSLMGDMSNSENKGLNKYEADKEHEAMQESISKAAKIALAQEACEKWRLRGNQAYANGNMSKAEDYYSRGINCISSIEMSRSCRALALCYSNRAATRMSLGRMREALGDCMMASAIDPEFLRVQVRAANCHLALGEVEDASLYFNKGLQSVSVVCLDRKIVIEASEGLQKAQKVAECMDCSAELLQKRTVNNADSALGIISEALSISPYSDRLLEMKAKALFMLRKYEEVIQLCEQTLDSAEKNFSSVSTDGLLAKLGDSELVKSFTVRFWRWRLISKSHFYLGRLEVALDLLEKLEHIESIMEKCGSKNAEPSVLLAVTVRELLRHKTSGNEAFQSGRYAEAIEHYTSALSCNSESRPFAAICFCNRAAASQALGQITDAIADCSIAIALDGNYLKAISRRATLHEMIRDYGQAANDLQRLISLLEKELEDKANQSGALGRSTSNLNDLRQARLRLSTIEDEARKEIPLNMYIILGVEPSGMASDIKKAYRKAALRHHPDKAGQFLARSENGDDGIWKEIAEEVHKDADRLFKMIGEAYTVLSEPTKRSRYDLEEEMRMAQKSSTPRTTADVYDHQFERTGNRRQWREGGKPYGNSYSRWSESSRSS